MQGTVSTSAVGSSSSEPICALLAALRISGVLQAPGALRQALTSYGHADEMRLARLPCSSAESPGQIVSGASPAAERAWGQAGNPAAARARFPAKGLWLGTRVQLPRRLGLAPGQAGLASECTARHMSIHAGRKNHCGGDVRVARPATFNLVSGLAQYSTKGG
jgi:hypothetical protein